MTELKPCPFCGTRNAHIRVNLNHFFYVLCEKDGCYVRTDGHLNREAAIESWNRRTDTKPDEIDFDYEAED